VQAAGKAGKAPLILARLTTRLSVGSHGLTKRQGKVAKQAAGSRAIRFDAAAENATPVQRWEHLNVSDRLVGPAMINGSTLTCPVPPGWDLRIDAYGNAEMRRVN
jgi:N-methylhydantoinase A/oxoprolinase/acetone carboxylase beta subunit